MNDEKNARKRWLKAELHSHCSLDPMDYRVCEHSPEGLIKEAARLGYEVLAITCHNLDVWNEDLSEYARSLGITLLPGMEGNAQVEYQRVLGAYRIDVKSWHQSERPAAGILR